MKIFYDKDRDYAELFFKNEKNYSEDIDSLHAAFKSEKNGKIIGYSFEEASSSIFHSTIFSSKVKLAALLKIIRAEQNLTQTNAAEKIGEITLRHYQRLEAGEDNPTLTTIESLIKAFPEYDFSQILKHPAA